MSSSLAWNLLAPNGRVHLPDTGHRRLPRCGGAAWNDEITSVIHNIWTMTTVRSYWFMFTRLHDLQRQLFELYRQERYGEALELVTAGIGKIPDGTSRIAFWSACLQCKLERPEEALATLIHHFELGEWFNPDRLAGDEDLAPLRDDPEFERLIEACRGRRQTEQADLQPLLLMEAAATVEEKPPLVLALHMMGGDADESRSHWLPVSSIGAALAAPRGSELLGPGEFGWGEGTEAVLRRQLATVAERQPFDRKRLVLGGASQGARFAVQLAMAGAIAAPGEPRRAGLLVKKGACRMQVVSATSAVPMVSGQAATPTYPGA
jgi:hypothetical protein